MVRVKQFRLVAVWIATAAVAPTFNADDMVYRKTVESWRRKQEAALQADDGWLTVAGLFWLKEGANRAGADPSNDIVLPAGSVPGRVGVFQFSRGQTIFQVETGVKVTINDRPVTTVELKPDVPGPPDVIAIGDLKMYVIQRGNRYGIRLRDKNSKLRREFTGLGWFPVRESLRVRARFVPYDPPKLISIPNLLGDTEKLPSPGYAVFTLDRRQHRLEPVESGDTELFFIFKDLTSGKETYPAGRFLYTEMPRHGEVILDFNKARNPPCAYTPFATCPLPPRQNHLPARMEAGETYHAAAHGSSLVGH